MSVRKRSTQALLMTVLVAQFAACGGDGPTGTTVVSVASVEVTPGSANLTALGLTCPRQTSQVCRARASAFGGE